MSDPLETEPVPEPPDWPDELDELLADLPPDVAHLIKTRWSSVPPGPATYWVACQIARNFAVGVTPQALALADVAMEMATLAERLEIDAASSWLRDRQNAAIARERADKSGAVRRDRTAERDAAIRAEWRERENIASKNRRAELVIIALRRRTLAERWRMPGPKQVILIAERD